MLIPTCFLLCGGAISAQPQGFHRPARSAQRVVVTPEGAFYSGRARPMRPHGPLPLQTAGTLWTHTDGGLVWIGNALALGNHGSEVFCEYDLNNERAELFSAFDSDPPTALWSDLSAQGSDDHHVASAETSDVQVALHTFNQGQPGASCVLSKYSSLSSVPDWTYTFPIAPNGGTNVGISRDGQTIVAAASDLSNSNVEIAVFGPGSNVPVSYTTYPLGGTNNCIRGFDLSADGSTLYFSSAGTPVAANIFDVASATVVFNTLINASFDSHGISGDGSVFAFGNFGLLQVWQKVAGYYINTLTHFVPGANYCGYLDVSDDGSTVACGFTFYIGYQQVEIDAIDVPTMSVTMSDVFSSANPLLQNIVSGVSVSADGQRFAIGLWGDGSGPLAEARLYSKNQNAPLATINLNGSVFGLQISADGQRAAFGSKAVHANQLGNGGRISLLGDSTPFTHFCCRRRFARDGLSVRQQRADRPRLREFVHDRRRAAHGAGSGQPRQRGPDRERRARERALDGVPGQRRQLERRRLRRRRALRRRHAQAALPEERGRRDSDRAGAGRSRAPGAVGSQGRSDHARPDAQLPGVLPRSGRGLLLRAGQCLERDERGAGELVSGAYFPASAIFRAPANQAA